ncbi:putative krueppel c2h2-type zinc finger protein [Erysiphe neolycopersici]|uniref:Putative krueppel c2h2-type zinc finger protein n=1 Tax=Erysiphe neolycopersici TaxID=212602 RepID=A0A420HQD1_9PEZI|nr:putative krueppel c2h2-type zinc finger protein [Erysiphe neolycopersici]
MAPALSRSLLPSSSSKLNLKRENVVKKKFACSFSGCGKCFSRSEHLQRHALNHKDGDNTCLRCMTHFRRRDLLDRHMARHKEKDDKAGGEGLGFLATRKKLYRNAEGKIVNARRPPCVYELVKGQVCRSQKEEAKPMAMIDNGSPVASSYELGQLNEHKVEELSQNLWQEMAALPSPPTSEVDSETFKPNPRNTISVNLENSYDNSWHASSHSLSGFYSPYTVLGRQPECPPGPIWASQRFQTFMGAMGETTPEDLFRIDMGLHEWQAWNNQVVMSRCRDDKGDGFEEKRRHWSTNPAAPQEGMTRREFGLSSC